MLRGTCFCEDSFGLSMRTSELVLSANIINSTSYDISPRYIVTCTRLRAQYRAEFMKHGKV